MARLRFASDLHEVANDENVDDVDGAEDEAG